MHSSKSIIVFICLWLILSCVLLDNSQGFEVRLSKTARRWKHKPRKTQENHQQYVKQMADFFSRFVVCIEDKNAFHFVCLSVCLLSRSVTLQLKECKTGAPNDGFLLNTLKTPFRLSRALLDIQRCILSGAINFATVRSSQGILSLFEITRASVLFSRKFYVQLNVLRKGELFLCLSPKSPF